MPTITVTYTQTRTMTQTIEWPEDEMDDFNLANLECNLEPDDAQEQSSELDLYHVTKDGEPHDF